MSFILLENKFLLFLKDFKKKKEVTKYQSLKQVEPLEKETQELELGSMDPDGIPRVGLPNFYDWIKGHAKMTHVITLRLLLHQFPEFHSSI